MDGLSNVMMYLNLCDEPDIKNVPSIMIRFSPFQQMLQLLLMPVYLIWLTTKLLFFMEDDKSPFTKPEIIKNLTVQKNYAICHDLSLDLVKKRSKQLGCTINDIIMTAASRTIKQHFESLGDSTKSIRLAFPFSLRPPPSTVDDI